MCRVSAPIAIYEVGGIGGSYDIQLPVRSSELDELDEPMAIKYTVLDGKHAVGMFVSGSAVRLSQTEADVLGQFPVKPLDNLKIRLTDDDGKELDVDIYAKVLAREVEEKEGFAIRFTSVPDAAKDVISRHLF